MVTVCASLVFHPSVTNRMSVNVPMERGSSQNTCVRTVVIRAFSDSLAGTHTHMQTRTHMHTDITKAQRGWGMVCRKGDMDCLCACVDISAAAACVFHLYVFLMCVHVRILCKQLGSECVHIALHAYVFV